MKAQHEIINVTDTDKLDEFYNNSSLTVEGLNIDENDIKLYGEFIEKYTEFTDNKAIFYVIKGKLMDDYYNLTGDNRYPDDLNICVIKNDNLKDLNAIIIPRFQFGGRWFDDVVDNNRRREEEKE